MRSVRNGKVARKATKARPGPKFSKDLVDQSGLGIEVRPKPLVVSVEKLKIPVSMSVSAKAMKEDLSDPPPLDVSAVSSLGTLEADEDTADTSLMSASELMGRSRTRGRPPTTGEYVGLAAAKKAAVAAMREEIALKNQMARAEGIAETGGALPRVDDLAEEAREQPTAELGADIFGQMEVVERLATTANHLKGTYVRDLRVAARRVKAAATELVTRTASATDHPAVAECKRLRNTISAMEEEMASLRQRGTRKRVISTSGDDATMGGYMSVGEFSPPRKSSTPLPTKEEKKDLPLPISEEALLAKVGAMMEEKLGAVLKTLAPKPPPSALPKAAPSKASSNEGQAARTRAKTTSAKSAPPAPR